MNEIDYIGVILASISAFLLGGIWYGPLFGKVWKSNCQQTEENLAQRKPRNIFTISFLLTTIAAFSLSQFIPDTFSIAESTLAGFAAGFTWASTFLGVIYLFEKRNIKHFLVNAGYITVALSLMGLIIGSSN